MGRKLELAVFALALAAAALIPYPLAAGQAAGGPSLAEQLSAQYKLVKMGSDSSGPTVLEEGTVLAIQKGGVLGVPQTNNKPCAAKYENGTLKPPGTFCTAARGHAFSSIRSRIPGGDSSAQSAADTRYFNKGDKVYPSAINVDVKDEKIVFSVVACDTCNQTNPPTYYKAQVDFQFAAGYLEKADASKVEDTIGEVFAIDNSGQDTGQAAPAAPAPADQPAAAPAAAPAQPVSIQLGQTIDQVVAALGQPDKTVNLGAKQIYVYKDLKVTFVNGKVTDVQ
jgi:hypothetical protein